MTFVTSWRLPVLMFVALLYGICQLWGLSHYDVCRLSRTVFECVAYRVCRSAYLGVKTELAQGKAPHYFGLKHGHVGVTYRRILKV